MNGWTHEDYELAPSDLIGEIIDMINEEQQEIEEKTSE